VLNCKAPTPIAVLEPPVVFVVKAFKPNAELYCPDEFDANAPLPTAELPLTLPPPNPTVRP